jgi:hypothetical protein
MTTGKRTKDKILKSTKDVTQLAERLGQCPGVTRFDTVHHKEAPALADSLFDLEDAFREFLDDILPNLVSSRGEELCDLLLDTAENFRHVLYHIIVQQKFFRYVAPNLDLDPPDPK